MGGVMAHPIEGIIREAYIACARGDLDGYFGACPEDWNFNIVGQGAIAGTYRGKQGLHELAQKAVATTSGTFQEDVEDVLANDQHCIVLARHRFTRSGQQQESHRPCLRDPRRQAGSVLGASA
jgi:ketosteroid isomerase-like protein